MTHWETLGAVAPRQLADARLQLHWAVQAASAPGRQLLAPRADSSEQSLRWEPGVRALAQEPVGEGREGRERPFRSALRPYPPAVLLLDGNAEGPGVLAEMPLAGRTLEEVYTWLEKDVARRLGRPLAKPLERPGDMPAHRVGEGSAFDASDAAAFAEIGRWYADAHHILSTVATWPGASPVRCWPHHFDLATLIALDSSDTAAESARAIGVGFSPGDGGRSFPYLYVTPWPYPPEPKLPELAGGGVWNTAGWLGAVLEAAALIDAGGSEAQERRAERFVESAIGACRRLLGAI